MMGVLTPPIRKTSTERSGADDSPVQSGKEDLEEEARPPQRRPRIQEGMAGSLPEPRRVYASPRLPTSASARSMIAMTLNAVAANLLGFITVGRSGHRTMITSGVSM